MSTYSAQCQSCLQCLLSQAQASNQYIQYQAQTPLVSSQAANQFDQYFPYTAAIINEAQMPTPVKTGKTWFCSEPNCVETRGNLYHLKIHMRNAHAKVMDPTQIKCVFPKARSPTKFMCTHCQQACQTHGKLKQHFKSPKHVKNLVLMWKVPRDTWELVSKDVKVLEQTDTTNSDTALSSLLEIVDQLRDQKPTPDCIIIKSEPQ